MAPLKRCALLLIAAALLQSCNKDDAANSANQLCLDRPDRVSAAPSGKLPCELLPPGLILKQ